MDLGTSFDVLSELIEEYESRGNSVERVETTTAAGDPGRLHATVDLRIPLCPAAGELSLTPEAATVTEDGLSVEFDALVPTPEAADATVSADTQDARVANEDLLVTISLDVASAGDAEPTSRQDDESDPTGRVDASAQEQASGARSDRAAHLAAVRNDDLPPYEDTDYLQLLYDTCETFTEMSREIEMDVSSETVRRYMIEADIHTPASYDTGRDADDTTVSTGSVTENPIDIPDEQLVTDGAGLPADLQVSDIVEAVVDAMTVYEVQRDLGLDGPRTRELLSQLNLLDLVVHRVADAPEQDRSYEEVAARIRQSAAVR